MTAPKCFGDGYVMPIVAVSVDGEVLLEFEEGFENFLEHLKKVIRFFTKGEKLWNKNK